MRSARYAGEGSTDLENSERLLEQMKGKIDRGAAFHCVISIAVPTGAALTYEGECRGTILEQPRGENGFGYDPLFFYPELNKTFAEISMEEKSRVSHRGIALHQVAGEFDKVLDWIDINMPEFEVVCHQ